MRYSDASLFLALAAEWKVYATFRFSQAILPLVSLAMMLVSHGGKLPQQVKRPRLVWSSLIPTRRREVHRCSLFPVKVPN